MTFGPLKAAAGAMMLVWLPACNATDHMRLDGVSRGAGDAVASNTVMQMVDPWQRGVEDADLQVPAERSPRREAAEASDAADAIAGAED